MARRAAKFTNLPIYQIYHCPESVLSLASCLTQWRLRLPRSSMLEAQTCKTDNGYLVVCILYHTVQHSWRFERLPLKIQTYHSACPHAGDNQSCCRVKHVSTVTCQQSWVPSPTYHQRPGMLDVPQGITILSLSEPHHFVKLSTWTKENSDQKSMWAAHNVIYTV